MKPGMVVINTARGALIDEAAPLRAVDDGTVSAAGCRGLGCDAARHPGDPLLAHPRVRLNPHLGFNTRAAVERIFAETVASIAAGPGGQRRNRID